MNILLRLLIIENGIGNGFCKFKYSRTQNVYDINKTGKVGQHVWVGWAKADNEDVDVFKIEVEK